MSRTSLSLTVFFLIASILTADGDRPQWNQFPLNHDDKIAWLRSVYEEDVQKQENAQLSLGMIDCYYLYRLTRQVQEIQAQGERIRLYDGSLWRVHPQDRSKLLQWVEPLRIYVTQNSDLTRRLLSDFYSCKLVNFDRNQSIRAQLVEAPLYTECDQILSIDKEKKKVTLSSSLWKVSSYDREILQTWEPRDFILIGANTRWNHRSKAYLLVNITRDTMVRAKEK